MCRSAEIQFLGSILIGVTMVLTSSAFAQEPLSFCLSREKIAVTVGESFTGLDGVQSRDHTLALRSVIATSLQGFGSSPVQIEQHPSPVGSIEGLAAPLDESVQRHATLLLAVGLDASEYKLTSAYLKDDASPLRTIKLLINGWVVDTKTRDILAHISPERTYVATSTDEAVARLTEKDLGDSLAVALAHACAQRKNLPLDNTATPEIASGEAKPKPKPNPTPHKPPSTLLPGPRFSMQEKEKIISLAETTAQDICNKIGQSGSNSKRDISAIVSAGVGRFTKMITNAGIEVKAEGEISKYDGVPQQDLAVLLKSAQDCREREFNMLLKKMWPGGY